MIQRGTRFYQFLFQEIGLQFLVDEVNPFFLKARRGHGFDDHLIQELCLDLFGGAAAFVIGAAIGGIRLPVADSGDPNHGSAANSTFQNPEPTQGIVLPALDKGSSPGAGF